MSNSLRYSLLLMIVMMGLLLVAGCAGSEQTTETETVEQQRDLSEMEDLFWSRIESSRMNFTEADVDFMVGMIAHHAQALIMSRLAPENGASRSVQVLAARIINAQDDEIALMQKWLRDRGQPVPEVRIDGLNLMIHGAGGHHSMDHHHDMPGMLTQQQLEELAASEGREFDRKFLRFMIEHHEGAVIMVQDLFAADGAASDTEAFELASGIKAEQVTEIERMKGMLEDLELN